eukprot:2358836-Rhodomonas_salina.2
MLPETEANLRRGVAATSKNGSGAAVLGGRGSDSVRDKGRVVVRDLVGRRIPELSTGHGVVDAWGGKQEIAWSKPDSAQR